MLSYIKTSLKHLLSDSRWLLLLLVVAQIFSVIVIVFSYGIVNHYNTKVDVAESSSLTQEFMVKKDMEDAGIYIEHKELDKCLAKILPMVENKLKYFFVDGYCDGYNVMSSTGYEKGKYTVSSQIKDKVSIKTGEKYTEEDVLERRYCILATEELVDGSGYAMLGDEKYEIKGVIGIDGMKNSVFVPYGVLPKKTNITWLSLVLEKPLLETEFNEIVEIVQEHLGDIIEIPEFEGVMNESNNKVYRDIIVVSVILIFVFAIDYCIIYRYILEKRRRIFAVCRICGASKMKLSIVYMLELLGLSLITLIIGIYIFHNAILSEAANVFEYIELYCNPFMYKEMSKTYMGILLVAYGVLVTKFVRKTPVSLMKEV